jgi:hypothetical protein
MLVLLRKPEIDQSVHIFAGTAKIFGITRDQPALASAIAELAFGE